VRRERPDGPDRRHGSDRRTVPDRRIRLTRRLAARRRDTPTPFSLQQLETLRQVFSRPGPVSCPACGSGLALGAARRSGSDTMRRVSCYGCGKAAVLSNTYPARVLVIEQKDVMRDALRAILAGAGHEIVEAADAGVGLVAYQDAPADVVLIDVHAAGRMSAADFVRRLRREYPDARVVGMAGRPSITGVDPLAVTHGLGAVSTIRAPFTAAEVLKSVDEARR
jgi:CheY-like chemotaxis protein